MPHLQTLFRSREGLDSRKFDVWYHNDDVKSLVWSKFNLLPRSDRASMMEPFVFFDGIGDNGFPFDSLMNLCRERLEASDKSYFPFIFKPEIGGAHYMAAILRKETEGTRLFLFNPLGYTDKSLVQSRLLLSSTESSGGMRLQMSPHLVQTKENEDGPLVSCGPLCVEFLTYAMEHPQWVAALDEAFTLPEHLMQLVGMEKALYQQKIKMIRQSHDVDLGSISDDDIEAVEDFFSATTLHFIEAIQADSSSKAFHWDDDDYLLQDDEYSSSSDEYYSFSEDDYIIDDYESLTPDLKDQKLATDDKSITPDLKDQKLATDDKSINPEPKDQKLATERKDILPPPCAFDRDKIDQERLKFELYLTCLKNKTTQLIDKGIKTSRNYKPSYESVAIAASQLNEKLEASKTAFFKEPGPHAFVDFKKEIVQALSDASREFRQHRGVWHTIHPIIKNILGVLAAMTILPALIIAASPQGYVNTFFKTPPTDSEKQLQNFKQSLEGEDGSFENINNAMI